jgi:hypothetical protein
LVRRAGGTCRARVTEARVGDLGGAAGGCGGGGEGGDGGVAAVGGLGATGVVGTIIQLASIHVSDPNSTRGRGRGGKRDVPTRIRARIRSVPTVLNTVIAPRLADVERQRLRVLRHVGHDAVFAHAGVCQCVGVAFVGLGGQARDARLLRADERALGALVEAPAI